MGNGAGIWGMDAAARRALLDNQLCSTSRWIAARTRGGREQEALVNVQDQGFVGWLPRLREKRQIVFLFPGFLFVLIRRRWLSLRGTRGILDVVMSGDRPGRITERDLRWIREHEDENGVVVFDEPVRFKSGDKISVRSGRLCGLSGIYECSSARDRCRVLLGVLGGARAEISEDDLEHAPPMPA